MKAPTSLLTSLAFGGAFFAATGAASADPPQSAQALANILAKSGIEAGSGFKVTRAMTCGKGRDPQDPSLHCTTFLADAGRGGRPAYLEIMVFDRATDFEARAEKIKAAVEVSGRWTIEWQPDVTLSNSKTGGSLKLPAHCYQARGDNNGDAFCLIQASNHALAFAQVKPAHPSSDSISVGKGSTSYEDTEHASDLAIRGAIAVAKASK